MRFFCRIGIHKRKKIESLEHLKEVITLICGEKKGKSIKLTQDNRLMWNLNSVFHTDYYCVHCKQMFRTVP